MTTDTNTFVEDNKKLTTLQDKLKDMAKEVQDMIDLSSLDSYDKIALRNIRKSLFSTAVNSIENIKEKNGKKIWG